MKVDPALLGKYTWERLKQVPPGEVLYTGVYRGVLFGVKKGEMSLCAYIVVPADVDDDLLSCHGGVTYGSGDAKAGYKVLGWDYGHGGGDQIMLPAGMPPLPGLLNGGKQWDLKAVLGDTQRTLDRLALTPDQKRRTRELSAMKFDDAMDGKEFVWKKPLKAVRVEF